MTDVPYFMKTSMINGDGEREIEEGIYDEPSEIDCVNALLYEIKGDKSEYELAYVDEIRPVTEDSE
jgi:hypothetical protein